MTCGKNKSSGEIIISKVPYVKNSTLTLRVLFFGAIAKKSTNPYLLLHLLESYAIIDTVLCLQRCRYTFSDP